jgi:hypothetical protein
MDRPISYTAVKHNGETGWKLPYAFGVLPSSGRVIAIDPNGVTRLVSRKLLARF